MKLSDYFPDPAVKPLAEVANWRAAVQLAGDGLEAQGATTAEYTAEMLAAIDDLGPYIVIAPGFALAHSRPSPAVLRTGMSFVSLVPAIEFGSKANDPVSIVIGLAAPDSDSHLQAMSALARVLSDDAVMARLRAAQTPREVRAILDAATEDPDTQNHQTT